MRRDEGLTRRLRRRLQGSSIYVELTRSTFASAVRSESVSSDWRSSGSGASASILLVLQVLVLLVDVPCLQQPVVDWVASGTKSSGVGYPAVHSPLLISCPSMSLVSQQQPPYRPHSLRLYPHGIDSKMRRRKAAVKVEPGLEQAPTKRRRVSPRKVAAVKAEPGEQAAVKLESEESDEAKFETLLDTPSKKRKASRANAELGVKAEPCDGSQPGPSTRPVVQASPPKRTLRFRAT